MTGPSPYPIFQLGSPNHLVNLETLIKIDRKTILTGRKVLGNIFTVGSVAKKIALFAGLKGAASKEERQRMYFATQETSLLLSSDNGWRGAIQSIHPIEAALVFTSIRRRP